MMSREFIISLLRLVLPYPLHWYESKSLHQLNGMYAEYRGAISRKRVQLAFEADDRRLQERLKKKPFVPPKEDNGLPFF